MMQLSLKLLQGIEKFSQVHGKTSAALLDLYPVLRSLPDAVLSERRHAKQLHEKSSELFVGLWLDVKNAIKNGTAKPCFCVDLVRAQEEENISDELAAYISGSILEAGSDTTAAELVSCTYSPHAPYLKLIHQSHPSDGFVPRGSKICAGGTRSRMRT